MSRLGSLLSLRPTRLETVLLILLVVSSWLVATAIVSSRGRPASPRQPWIAQEQQVQQRLQIALGKDRVEIIERLKAHPALARRVQWVALGVWVLFLGALFSWMSLFIRAVQRRPLWDPLGSPSAATWGFREILRVVLSILVAAQAALWVQWVWVQRIQPPSVDRHLLTLGNTLFLDGVVMAGVGAAILRGRLTSGGSLMGRIPWGDWLKKIRFGIISYVTFLPVLGLLLLLGVNLLRFFKVEPTHQPIFTLYLSESRTFVLSVLLLLAGVVGPIAEELFFRGLLYRWLRQRIGIVKALALTAFFFSLLHGNSTAFLPIFGLGILFGWVYETTGTLVAPMAIHILHNGGMLTLASLIKETVFTLGDSL